MQSSGGSVGVVFHIVPSFTTSQYTISSSSFSLICLHKDTDTGIIIAIAQALMWLLLHKSVKTEAGWYLKYSFQLLLSLHCLL